MINVEAIIYILSTSIILFVINLLILNYYRSVISEELDRTNHNLGLIESNLFKTNRILARLHDKIDDLDNKNKERVNGLQKEINILSGNYRKII